MKRIILALALLMFYCTEINSAAIKENATEKSATEKSDELLNSQLDDVIETNDDSSDYLKRLKKSPQQMVSLIQCFILSDY